MDTNTGEIFDVIFILKKDEPFPPFDMTVLSIGEAQSLAVGDLVVTPADFTREPNRLSDEEEKIFDEYHDSYDSWFNSIDIYSAPTETEQKPPEKPARYAELVSRHAGPNIEMPLVLIHHSDEPKISSDIWPVHIKARIRADSYRRSARALVAPAVEGNPT